MEKKKKQVMKIEPLDKIMFLNLPGKESAASIGVRISPRLRDWDAYAIYITDCDDTIKLHGSLGSIESRKNAINKFDTMIDILINARNHIVFECRKKELKIFNKTDQRNLIINPSKEVI